MIRLRDQLQRAIGGQRDDDVNGVHGVHGEQACDVVAIIAPVNNIHDLARYGLVRTLYMYEPR